MFGIFPFASLDSSYWEIYFTSKIIPQLFYLEFFPPSEWKVTCEDSGQDTTKKKLSVTGTNDQLRLPAALNYSFSQQPARTNSP